MEKLPYSIKDEYSAELNNISNRLAQLKNGRVYELSNAKMDGFLYTNIEKLEKDIYDLLFKIQTGKEGFCHEIAEKIAKLEK
ncbi:MAG: hypothetical protein ACI4YB_04235 [Oscillospiraceae bacterium]